MWIMFVLSVSDLLVVCVREMLVVVDVCVVMVNLKVLEVG